MLKRKETNLLKGVGVNIRISRVTMQDLQVLQDLSIETFAETFGEQNPPEDLELYLEKAF